MLDGFFDLNRIIIYTMDVLIERVMKDKDLVERIMKVIDILRVKPAIIPAHIPAVIPATLPIKRKCVFGFGDKTNS
jgi:hypothetical protein